MGDGVSGVSGDLGVQLRKGIMIPMKSTYVMFCDDFDFGGWVWKRERKGGKGKEGKEVRKGSEERKGGKGREEKEGREIKKNMLENGAVSHVLCCVVVCVASTAWSS